MIIVFWILCTALISYLFNQHSKLDVTRALRHSCVVCTQCSHKIKYKSSYRSSRQRKKESNKTRSLETQSPFTNWRNKTISYYAPSASEPVPKSSKPMATQTLRLMKATAPPFSDPLLCVSPKTSALSLLTPGRIKSTLSMKFYVLCLTTGLSPST